MLSQKFRLKVLFIFLLSFCGLACEKGQPDCNQPSVIQARIAFMVGDSTRVDTLIDSILVDTILMRYHDTFFRSPTLTSVGMPQNIKIFGDPQANFIAMPLDPDSSRIRYVLRYDTTQPFQDTLTFVYGESVHFISNACGFTHFYNIDSFGATNHQIDSFTINTRAVTDKASDRHITLYFFNR